MNLQQFTSDCCKQQDLVLSSTTNVDREDTPVVFVDIKLTNGKTEYIRLAKIDDYYRGMLMARKLFNLQNQIEINLYVYDTPTEEELELELARADSSCLQFKEGMGLIQNLYNLQLKQKC